MNYLIKRNKTKILFNNNILGYSYGYWLYRLGFQKKKQYSIKLGSFKSLKKKKFFFLNFLLFKKWLIFVKKNKFIYFYKFF